MDGYHVSHDPAVEYTVEPTTGRKLNILDVPNPSGSKKPAGATAAAPKSSRRDKGDIAKGRALSPSKIQHPKPSKPYASRQIRESDFAPTVDDLTRRFAGSRLSDSNSDGSSPSLSNSPPSSVGSSLSSRSGSSKDSGSRSSGSTSPSSLSSLSDHGNGVTPCRCERYGITRKGDRVKLDCGGSRCGYVTESSEASCSESEDDEAYRRARSAVRRQGIVVRR